MKKFLKGLLTLAVVGALFTTYSIDSQAANIGYENVTQETLNAANTAHSYYGKKIPQEAITLAEANAKYYADAIMADPELTTDLDRYVNGYVKLELEEMINTIDEIRDTIKARNSQGENYGIKRAGPYRPGGADWQKRIDPKNPNTFMINDDFTR